MVVLYYMHWSFVHALTSLLCPKHPILIEVHKYVHILRKLKEHINIYLCTIASEQTEHIKSTQPLGLEITTSLDVLT